MISAKYIGQKFSGKKIIFRRISHYFATLKATFPLTWFGRNFCLEIFFFCRTRISSPSKGFLTFVRNIFPFLSVSGFRFLIGCVRYFQILIFGYHFNSEFVLLETTAHFNIVLSAFYLKIYSFYLKNYFFQFRFFFNFYF